MDLGDEWQGQLDVPNTPLFGSAQARPLRFLYQINQVIFSESALFQNTEKRSLGKIVVQWDDVSVSSFL